MSKRLPLIVLFPKLVFIVLREVAKYGEALEDNAANEADTSVNPGIVNLPKTSVFLNFASLLRNAGVSD